MACCRRRTLTSNFSLLSCRLTPTFAHIRRDDHERTEPPNRLPFPPIPSLRSGHASAFPSPAFPFGGSRDLGFSLPLGLSPCHLRSYSSSHGPSSEIDGVDDVAVVLSDSSVEIASAAAALPPAPVPGEVAAAAADSFLPVAALQHLIDAVHSFSGLNWWASIALTTVLIRVATIPLILNQMKSTMKLNMMRPEIEQIKEQMNPMDPQSVQEGQQQMKAMFLKYGVTPFTPLKGLFIQGPIFISFFLAISNMVEKVPSFKGGGSFWFTDLTTPDPQYMLPALAALTFLATVELNMQEGMEGNPMLNTMKNFSRVLALMTVPFTAHFPKAIFCYWITSNLFSLAHGFAIRQPPVRKFLKLPDLASQPAPAAPPDFSIFGGSKPMAPTASPLPAKESEQTSTPEKRLSTSALISLRIRSLEKAMKARNRLKKG